MKSNNLSDINFTVEQKGFIRSLINKFGTSQHPYCDVVSFDYFKVSYLKQIVKKKSIANKITEDGIRILNELKEILNINGINTEKI